MSGSKIRLDRISVEYDMSPRRSGLRFWNRKKDCSQAQPKVVLHDISLEIQPGEFVCFLGHSGCGKSTLLEIIAGFRKPDRGSVWVDGVRVEGPQADHVFVFQEGSLFPWLTIVDNVAVALRSIKDSTERFNRAKYYLELVALEGICSYYPHMLSGGMRQRAEIARALAVEPDILLMDEPFTGLDYLTRLNLREEMVNLHLMFPQTTILFVTHDIDEALQLSDRLIILTDPPTQLKSSHSIGLPHPRVLTCSALSELRSQIYHHLGVHTAI